MSRIGVKPIPVPNSVSVEIGAGNAVKVKGPKGELSQKLTHRLQIVQEDGEVRVVRATDGYTKTLEIQGVGYRAQLQGQNLVLNVGFSHPVTMTPPEGITYQVEGNNRVMVSGINKQVVGEEAARIRGVRPPEPYKGKGIRYAGEVVRRKAGKAGKAK